MNFPFFNRLQVKKVVAASGEAGQRAETMLLTLLREQPDVLLAYIADNRTGTMLASYTTSSAYNPNQLNLRNTKLLGYMSDTLAANSWLGGPLLDMSMLLEEELHYLRPVADGQWHCFVAVRLADVNLGILKEVVRLATT
jgi:hypothetical protein